MKTKTKWLIGAAVLTLAVGGYAMKELVFGFGDEVFVKKPTKEEKQLAYLKEHEQEIIDFVKAQNPKIESVQIDWDDVRRSDGMAFETSEFIHLYGEFNHNHETSWHVQIEIKEDGHIDLENMILVNGLRIGGNYFE